MKLAWLYSEPGWRSEGEPIETPVVLEPEAQRTPSTQGANTATQAAGQVPDRANHGCLTLPAGPIHPAFIGRPSGGGYAAPLQWKLLSLTSERLGCSEVRVTEYQHHDAQHSN
jgi:hypothetical protein